jgi:hypothetical protein
MEAESTSLKRFYQTTRRNIPENNHLHTRRREKLKSHQEVYLQYSQSPPCYISIQFKINSYVHNLLLEEQF